jgi:dTDP-glucose 4,6-dehydratase
VDRSITAPGTFIKTNIQGTYTLLEQARRFWSSLGEESRNIFRFLHISTDEVYGSLPVKAPAFTEASPYAPNSPYAASKAASDHLVRAYGHTWGLPTLVTHCSNNYGPFQFPEKLIPLVILNGLEGKRLPIYGDGGNIRDWIFVKDHCAALRAVLDRGRPGETYNIGGSCEKTNLQVVNAVCRLLDELIPDAARGSRSRLLVHIKDRPGHDRRYAVDSSTIARELRWRPTVSFEAGLRRTVTWYLDHPAWVESIRTGAYLDWIEHNYADSLAR